MTSSRLRGTLFGSQDGVRNIITLLPEVVNALCEVVKGGVTR